MARDLFQEAGISLDGNGQGEGRDLFAEAGISPDSPRPKRESKATAADYLRALDSGVAQGVANIGAGIGTFVQAPAANTLSGVMGAKALADRGLTWLINKAGGDGQLDEETQQAAQAASRFAADARAENAASPLNLPARAGRYMEEDSRRVVQDIQAKDRTRNPELISQQENMGKAEGFTDNLKAAIDNPLALTHTLARSAPDMAAGVGVGATLARAGAGVGAVSTAGILSESGSSAMQAREGVYQQVAGMPVTALAASPRFKEILKETGGDAQRARELLANELADQAPLLSGAGTAAGSVLVNKLFGGDATAKSIVGGEKMSVREFGKRVAQDTLEEGAQGVPEDTVQFGAEVQADPSKKYDPAGSLAQNMVAGMAMGAGGHGFAFARDNLSRQGAGGGNEQNVSEAGPTGKAPAGEAASSAGVDGTQSPPSPGPAPENPGQRPASVETNGVATPRPVQELDAEISRITERLQEVTPENGYGPAFDQERAELQTQLQALGRERQQAVPEPVDAAPTGGRVQPTEEGTQPPKDFWSFAKSKGILPSQIQVGSPEHQGLKAEYDALRSGVAEPVLPSMQQQDVNLQNRDRGRAASVVQMSEIARNPDYMRLGPSRTPDSGAPMVFAVGDDLGAIPTENFGREDVAVMSDGQRVPFRYAVVDANKINPSNFADGRANTEFGSNTPGVLKALNNGRTAGIRAAHEMGTAGEYVAGLQADAEMHGIPADIVARTPNPMLVRVYADAENTAGMAAKSQGQGLGMSPAELARQDAPLLDSSVLSAYQAGDVTSAANRDFVRAFVGKLNGAGLDIAGMMTADGQLSQDGRKRIQAALMQAAYEDADLIEEMFDSTDTDIKAIGEALKTTAGQWANMRDSARLGVINPQVDITQNLLQAIGLIRKARRDGTSLYDLVNQPDLMTGETPDAMTVGTLRMFYSGNYFTRAIGKDRLAQHLADYVQGAMATSADAGMFGDVVSPGEILETITPITEGRTNAEAQPQDSGREPAGSLDTGRSAGEVRSADGRQEPGAVRSEPDQDRGSQPRQDAQAETQQQVGQSSESSQEGNAPSKGGAQRGQQGRTQRKAAATTAESGKAEPSQGVATDPLLKAPTREEVIAKQEAESQARREQEAEARKAEDAERKRKEREEIRQRSETAADSFELGQDPLDSLTGQQSVFDAPAAAAPAISRDQERALYDYLRKNVGEDGIRYKAIAKKIERTADGRASAEDQRIALDWLQNMVDDAAAQQQSAAESEKLAIEQVEKSQRANDEKTAETLAELKTGRSQNPNYQAFLDTLEQADLDAFTNSHQINAEFLGFVGMRSAELEKASRKRTTPEALEQFIRDYADKNLASRVREGVSPTVSVNTVFTEDAAAKARERLKKKLGQLNSGLDPEMMMDGITLAGYHIERGARTFAAYARAMLQDLGEGVRPYLKSWYMGVKYDPRAGRFEGMDDAATVDSTDIAALNAQENTDAPGTNDGVEPNRPDATAERAVGDTVPADAGAVAASAEKPRGRTPGKAGRRQQDGAGVSARRPSATGNRGDFLLPGGNATVDAAVVAAGDQFRERGGDIGLNGVSVDPIPAAQVDAVAETGTERLTKEQRQRAADKIAVKPGDLENIKATLPYLLDGQQEDVKKAEDRFAVPDGYGMLFTNGTGTGKTFTGLGVVKRLQRQGKTNTLIVVPDDKIAADWVDSGKQLGLAITPLKDTQDAGKGIVITSYANLGDNDALARRQWDMVVADEAHSLMQSADGKVTTYLANLRAITHHPDGVGQRHTMLNRADIDRLRELSLRIDGNNKILNNQDTMDTMMTSVREENAKLQREADALAAKLREAREAVQAEVDSMQGAKRARLLALSATPFAYEFTVDWANGYLFDYNEGQADESTESRGYNSGSNRERFFMQHFGYSMRYNKLTRPDPTKVDTGLMQRNFNGWLRKRGALSARMLDVPADYDRRFVLVDSGIGNQIDDALNWVSEQARERKGEAGFSVLRDVIDKKFDYLSRRYLLEAIKATEVVPIVRQHMAVGRKVVVFHDYKKGGGFNPFDIEVPRTMPEDFPEERKADFESYKAALAEFRSRFQSLVNAPLGQLPSPIQVFQREFPDVLLVNGDEKKSDLLARYKKFQEDGSGPQVMLVQSAKNKGWSGHDTTGKHQRVLINLGQPTAPTLAIQQEGRIYRTGQVSDAIMRYLNTGTNWEKWTFATTIAGRASTAENLGMGEQARALKDAFIAAFEESDAYPPGHEGEGKGGKQRDALANSAITAYDRAKTYYWATQKKNSKTKAQEGVDYFATPEPLGFKMAEWLDLRGGESSLEPSAGHGAIARWLPEISNRTVIEPSNVLRSRLAMAMDASKDRIIDGTFEAHAAVNKYDGIAMNPPFGVGGKTAIEHLAKATTHLRDGGRVVALIPTGPAADKRFEQWMYGTEQRPIKPVLTDEKLGAIYAGDTVKSRATWAPEAKVVRSREDGLWVKVAGKPGETMISVQSVTDVQPTGARSREVRPADGIYMVGEVRLPQVTFERAGTGVATRIMVLEKQSDPSKAPQAKPVVDLTSIDDIRELFDRLEGIEMPRRTAEAAGQGEESKPPQAESAPAAAAPGKVKAANPEAVGTVDPEGAQVIEHVTGKGKTLRGIVRTGISKEDAQAIDPYTFRKDGGWFIREVYLKKPDDTPAMSRAEGPAMARADNAAIQEPVLREVVKAVTSRWEQSPPVVVVPNMQDLRVPEIARAEDARQRAGGAFGVPRGFFYRGTVYMVADGIASVKDAVETLFHEGLGHYGLRAVFGDGLAPILDQIAMTRPDLMGPKAKEYGKDLKKLNERREVAEEVLAEMAQTKPELGYVRRALAAIRTWLRENVPGFKNLAFSDAELVRNFIEPARGWVERGAKGQSAAGQGSFEPAFSIAEDAGAKALAEFAKADELYALPKSGQTSLEGIVADNDPSFKVSKPMNMGGRVEYTLTMPDGTKTTLSVRDPNPYGGEQVYDAIYTDDGMEMVAGRPGENPEDVPPTGDVWIDVSALKKGDFGAKMYNIAATYAHNTGRIFIGDPHGLSKDALRRRLEQMLSSALKFGTTAHLAPHPDQVRGGSGVPPLRWVYGDHVGNVERMIAASVKALDNAFPQSSLIEYRQDGNFYNSKNGKQLPRGVLATGLRKSIADRRANPGGDGSTGQAGWRTIARAALFRYLQSSIGDGSGGLPKRGSILARASGHVAGLERGEAGSGSFPQAERIFYSRAPVAQPSAAQRAEDIISAKTPSRAPLDTAARFVSRVTGLERLAGAVYDRAAFLLDRYTPETVKAGLVSDYGVPQAVIDQRVLLQGRQRVQLRKAGALIDKLSTLTRAESRVAYEWMNMDGQDPQAYISMMHGLPEESVAVLQDVQKMIDQLSKEAVRLGQLSPEAYERNKFAYLRRSYAKHILEQSEQQKAKRARVISILGDQYKGRGLSDSTSMDKIKAGAPDWWGRKLEGGKADAALKGEKFTRLERRDGNGAGTQPLPGMDQKSAGKLREIAYWPVGEPLPAKYSEWTQAGVWEVRDVKGANAIMWRDFTKQERESMGEVDEARFAIAKTLHGMVHDVEVGRYLEWLAHTQAKKEGDEIPGNVVEASERYKDTFKPTDWVRVPDTKVPGTAVPKYGKLAGRYLPGPVWNDLRQVVNGQFKPFGDTYAKVLSLWKTSKTALSPAVHMNNVMSNFVMADWHDVGAAHIAKSLRIILGAGGRDGTGVLGRAGNAVARAGLKDAEAAKEIMIRYTDSGGEVGSWATNEIAKEQLEPLLQAIEKELASDGDQQQAQVGIFAALQHALMLRLPSAWEAFKPTRAGKAVTTEASNLLKLYAAEDEVFRLAAWLKAKEGGASDMEAGKVARKSFLDYNINAPWVQAMRQSAWPFVSFTYRAVPMLAEIAGKKPHKLMKLMAVAGALNALGAALSGGGDDERKLLPEEKAGKVWGLVPKLIRMPWNDAHGSPVYLDIRRFVPLGDVFDVGQGNSAVPILPGLMPGGPLVVAGEVVLNRSAFTGKAITQETDTATQRAAKVADHLYKAFAPNLIGLPNTYATDGVAGSLTGRTDAFGREMSTAQALASSVGIKLGSYPGDVLRRNAMAATRAQISEIDKNIAQLRRQHQTGRLDSKEFQDKMAVEQEKKASLMRKLSEKLQ